MTTFTATPKPRTIAQIVEAVYMRSSSTEYIANLMMQQALWQLGAEHLDEDVEEIHAQTIKRFCDGELQAILDAYSPDDEPAINEGFNDYTDMLCKDGEISEDIYDSITFDFEGWDE